MDSSQSNAQGSNHKDAPQTIASRPVAPPHQPPRHRKSAKASGSVKSETRIQIQPKVEEDELTLTYPEATEDKKVTPHQVQSEPRLAVDGSVTSLPPPLHRRRHVPPASINHHGHVFSEHRPSRSYNRQSVSPAQMQAPSNAPAFDRIESQVIGLQLHAHVNSTISPVQRLLRLMREYTPLSDTYIRYSSELQKYPDIQSITDRPVRSTTYNSCISKSKQI